MMGNLRDCPKDKKLPSRPVRKMVACLLDPRGAKMVVRGSDLLGFHQRPRSGPPGEATGMGSRIPVCSLVP